mgnify:CR=1 FL=1|tara:strand:+ start:21742 stop:22098 length:357 start_codon:yes stop_codon:yes gene_type:complete
MGSKEIVLSYVDQVLARIRGDKDEETAQRNYRIANSAVNGQIASLSAKLVNAEIVLEKAQDALGNAKYPTELIGDTAKFIKNIVTCQYAVDEAEQALATVSESADYFAELLKEFNPNK